MRTLYEIIQMCKVGEIPTVDEMRYAICAMNSLNTFDGMALRDLAEAEKKGKKPFMLSSAEWQNKEHHSRWHRALNISPKEWLGPENDPDDPEVQERINMHVRLAEKIISKERK